MKDRRTHEGMPIFYANNLYTNQVQYYDNVEVRGLLLMLWYRTTKQWLRPTAFEMKSKQDNEIVTLDKL